MQWAPMKPEPAVTKTVLIFFSRHFVFQHIRCLCRDDGLENGFATEAPFVPQGKQRHIGRKDIRTKEGRQRTTTRKTLVAITLLVGEAHRQEYLCHQSKNDLKLEIGNLKREAKND